MLSAQIDELRKMAEYYDGSEVASIMRYAADTIWQLRESVHRERAEADTLRTQLADVTESMGRVEERCAKLRELLARVERARRDLCDAYPDAELLNCEECPAWSECKGDLADHMRELGVEVDG